MILTEDLKKDIELCKIFKKPTVLVWDERFMTSYYLTPENWDNIKDDRTDLIEIARFPLAKNTKKDSSYNCDYVK